MMLSINGDLRITFRRAVHRDGCSCRNAAVAQVASQRARGSTRGKRCDSYATLGELISIELILLFSGLMSGLSGFGFSAVGAGCLLFIEPITEAPLLQTLSTCNQFLSQRSVLLDRH